MRLAVAPSSIDLQVRNLLLLLHGKEIKFSDLESKQQCDKAYRLRDIVIKALDKDEKMLDLIMFVMDQDPKDVHVGVALTKCASPRLFGMPRPLLVGVNLCLCEFRVCV